jgi:hypothetical protein
MLCSLYVKNTKGFKTINRKQFDRLLKETIKDFEVMGDYEMVDSLNKILKHKDFKTITFSTISPLIELIVETKKRPILHPVDIEIRKEHKQMEKYIRQFLNWEVCGVNFGKFIFER